MFREGHIYLGAQWPQNKGHTRHRESCGKLKCMAENSHCTLPWVAASRYGDDPNKRRELKGKGSLKQGSPRQKPVRRSERLQTEVEVHLPGRWQHWTQNGLAQTI